MCFRDIHEAAQVHPDYGVVHWWCVMGFVQLPLVVGLIAEGSR